MGRVQLVFCVLDNFNACFLKVISQVTGRISGKLAFRKSTGKLATCAQTDAANRMVTYTG